MLKIIRSLFILLTVMLNLNLYIYSLNHSINYSPVIAINLLVLISIAVLTTAIKMNKNIQLETARENLINRIKNQYL